MEKTTIATLKQKKEALEPIVMLTAYDYTFARMVDEAGVDVVLVGDSLGMPVLGYPTTLPVSMEDMIRHTQAVSRGVKKALLVSDMPFLSFQTSKEEAVRNAGILLKSGAEAVKLEGGKVVAEIVKTLVGFGIPVMGHLGLTPQSVNLFGGYKVQGKTEHASELLLEEAKMLEEAGCFSIVLECIPAQLAKKISQALKIPTIGIGAGNGCDGQVLVIYDCLGLNPDFHPKFVKRFAHLWEEGLKGIQAYIQEVKARSFPDADHSF